MEQWIGTHCYICCRKYQNRYQYCLNSDGFIHYMRPFKGHSGGNKVDPSLLDNVQIPNRWSEYLYHVGSCLKNAFHHPLRIGCRVKRYKRRKTNSILHSRGSSQSFTISTSTIRNYSEGYLAGSTRRFSSVWYQYGESRGGRGKNGA